MAEEPADTAVSRLVARSGVRAELRGAGAGESLRVLDAFGLQEGREVRFLPNLRAGTAVFKFERG